MLQGNQSAIEAAINLGWTYQEAAGSPGDQYGCLIKSTQSFELTVEASRFDFPGINDPITKERIEGPGDPAFHVFDTVDEGDIDASRYDYLTKQFEECHTFSGNQTVTEINELFSPPIKTLDRIFAHARGVLKGRKDFESCVCAWNHQLDRTSLYRRYIGSNDDLDFNDPKFTTFHQEDVNIFPEKIEAKMPPTLMYFFCDGQGPLLRFSGQERAIQRGEVWMLSGLTWHCRPTMSRDIFEETGVRNRLFHRVIFSSPGERGIVSKRMFDATYDPDYKPGG